MYVGHKSEDDANDKGMHTRAQYTAFKPFSNIYIYINVHSEESNHHHRTKRFCVVGVKCGQYALVIMNTDYALARDTIHQVVPIR